MTAATTAAKWRRFHDNTRFFEDGRRLLVEFEGNPIGSVEYMAADEWFAFDTDGNEVGSEYTRIDAASYLTDWKEL